MPGSINSLSTFLLPPAPDASLCRGAGRYSHIGLRMEAHKAIHGTQGALELPLL